MNIVDLFLRTKWEGDLFTCGMVLAALLIGMLIYLVLFSVLLRIANRADSLLNSILVKRMRAPARLLLPLFSLMLLQPSLSIPAEMRDVAQHIFSISLIVLITWLVITIT